MLELVAAVRPGVRLREVSRTDELVVVGGGEIFRLPLTDEAVARQSVLVAALPTLRILLPVAVPRPKRVGVMADGSTAFTAERRLPGVPAGALNGVAALQWEGVLAALDDVPAGSLREWGVTHPPQPLVLLVDAGRGVLTGLVHWELSRADRPH